MGAVALVVLLACAAADVFACLVLFVLVWVEHRRVRREAAAAGEVVRSAAGPLGCLAAAAAAGLAAVYGLAWAALR
ncbi:MAG: hypothetical protein C0501_16260 [Isosphaera sp.]|nr:hypothetical protein [Isosphaera sp.]